MKTFESLTDYNETECDSCHEALNEYEEIDPCNIDGRVFCDSCGSEYIRSRCGTFRSVSDMTAELAIEHGWDLYRQAAFAVHPIKSVKHI